jgi:hypothetical protein
MPSKFERTKLCVSPLTGTVYIADISKKDKHMMLDTRIEVTENEFMHCIFEYLEAKYPDTICEVTVRGKPAMELKLIKQ